MTTTTAVRAVGVEELRRAWHAVQDGQFRTPRPALFDLGPGVERVWRPDEAVLPVLGCLPEAGATCLALAIATVAAPARVVECSPPVVSGLVGAATAELGTTSSGWVVGRRDQVQIARPTALHGARLPLPDDGPGDLALTVLDAGVPTGQPDAAGGWVAPTLRAAPHLVLVSVATVPGLRRLETALTMLERPGAVVVAVRGTDVRRWPRELVSTMGEQTRDQHRTGRWVAIPHDKRLALRGIDTAELPPALLSAARDVLRAAAPSQGGL